MNEWKPIETAPKDGTNILLLIKWKSADEHHIDIGCWENDHWYCNSYNVGVGEAISWVPLPAIPKVSKNYRGCISDLGYLARKVTKKDKDQAK